VRVWPTADRKQERVLKRRAPKSHCPICRGRPAPAVEELLALRP
jgi:hypothetical protein